MVIIKSSSSSATRYLLVNAKSKYQNLAYDINKTSPWAGHFPGGPPTRQVQNHKRNIRGGQMWLIDYVWLYFYCALVVDQVSRTGPTYNADYIKFISRAGLVKQGGRQTDFYAKYRFKTLREWPMQLSVLITTRTSQQFQWYSITRASFANPFMNYLYWQLPDYSANS